MRLPLRKRPTTLEVHLTILHGIPMPAAALRRPSSILHSPFQGAAICLICLCVGVISTPQRLARAADRQIPAMHQSKSFLLHTDLPPAEAQQLLQRLETMFVFVAGYWGRPHRGVITIYVARDIGDWPAEVLATMDSAGVESIRRGGGLTVGTVMVRGNAFRSKAVVYAVADHGTPQHEAVHAYCNHAFGGTGPVWYAEGMAEVGNYWVEGDKGVSAPQPVLNYLKRTPTKSLDAIVNNPLETTGDSWQNYAWRWALCHLLGHSENYSRRFKPLGLQLLNRARTDFWQVYGSQAEEIEFEYRLFLETIVSGYRVDLCSWDWKTRFSPAVGSRNLACTIRADRGWQASRLLVSEGTEYEFAADGEWSLGEDAPKVTADGDDTDNGRLVGVILTDYQLSEPFDLSVAGSFTAPADGRLYLRCRDGWGSIADNSGSLSVRLKLQESGRRLSNESGGGESPSDDVPLEADEAVQPSGSQTRGSSHGVR
jgi:hypothetical protein